MQNFKEQMPRKKRKIICFKYFVQAPIMSKLVLDLNKVKQNKELSFSSFFAFKRLKKTCRRLFEKYLSLQILGKQSKFTDRPCDKLKSHMESEILELGSKDNVAQHVSNIFFLNHSTLPYSIQYFMMG